MNHRSHGLGRLRKLDLWLEAVVSTIFILMIPDGVTARSCGDDDDNSHAAGGDNDDGDDDKDDSNG